MDHSEQTFQIGEDWLQWAHSLFPEQFPTGERIDQLIAKLSPQERRVAYMVAVQDLSMTRTAEVMGIDPVHVRQICYKIRRKATEVIGTHEHDQVAA